MLTNSWEGQPVRRNCHRFTGLLVGTFGIRGLNLGIPPMKFDYCLRVSLEPLAPPRNLFEARCCQWSRKFEGCFHFDICFTTIFQLGSNHHLDYTGPKNQEFAFAQSMMFIETSAKTRWEPLWMEILGASLMILIIRWWFSNIFVLSSILGEMIQFDEHVFQMGWNQISLASLMTLQCQLT